MSRIETNNRTNHRIDQLVRERRVLEEILMTLKATLRQLLREHASFDRMRVIARRLRTATQLKVELERQLAESHRMARFVYPL